MQYGLAAMIRLLLAALLGIALALSLLYITQRRLIYLPTTKALTAAEAHSLGLKHWPAENDFRGFIAAGDTIPANAHVLGSEHARPRETGVFHAKGTVIVFHGNAGAAYHRTFYIDALQRQGLRVILAEYPGYGGRHGKPSESRLIDDAVATIQQARQTFPGPLYLWGESLGCGVVGGAVERLTNTQAHGPEDPRRRETGTPLAIEHGEQHVAGVVLMLPWDSLTRVAQFHYKFLPVSRLLHDRYPTTERLQDYPGNVAVIVATDDEIIPPQHSLTLYRALKGTKRLWRFEGATHNQLPIEPEQLWWGEVSRFLTE